MIRSILILCLSASNRIYLVGSDPKRGLSRLVRAHVWRRDGVLLRCFVVALFAISISGSCRLIANLTGVIVVTCNYTSALLHVSDLLHFKR